MNVKLLLEKFNYDSDKWDVCCDIKMLGFLLVLQGYKVLLYQVFMLSLSVKQQAVDQYFVGREWQVREGLEPGKFSMINQALISV